MPSVKTWSAGDKVFAADLNANFYRSLGSGADGALSVSSGTTTINLGGAKFVVKEYTSVNISGGTVNFSNPHAKGTTIIFRTLGDFNFTGGTIDLRGCGALNNNEPHSVLDALIHRGGNANGTSSAGIAGVRYAPYTPYMNQAMRALFVTPSAPGGNGGGGTFLNGSGFEQSNNTVPGVGGRGAAAFVAIVGGAYNFVSGAVFDGRGGNGTNGANASTGSPAQGAGAGPGSGAAGAMIWILYSILTADTGTYTVTGGAPGTVGTNVDGNGANGKAGGSAGNHLAAGVAGTNSTGSTGATGEAVREQNYFF